MEHIPLRVITCKLSGIRIGGVSQGLGSGNWEGSSRESAKRCGGRKFIHR